MPPVLPAPCSSTCRKNQRRWERPLPTPVEAVFQNSCCCWCAPGKIPLCTPSPPLSAPEDAPWQRRPGCSPEKPGLPFPGLPWRSRSPRDTDGTFHAPPPADPGSGSHAPPPDRRRIPPYRKIPPPASLHRQKNSEPVLRETSCSDAHTCHTHYLRCLLPSFAAPLK